MSSARAGTAGATRVCPHCKATILESAAVCPSCKHHVRFEAADQRAQDKSSALRVEGLIQHPPDGDPWEYSVVLTIRNDRGEEIARQVVGVGALRGGEQRTFTLDVEMFAPKGGKVASGSRH
jgi:hypothetical protein